MAGEVRVTHRDYIDGGNTVVDGCHEVDGSYVSNVFSRFNALA
jgi:hypothetical protein